MILLIDNYDSFTYNIVQLLRGLEVETRVIRNDEMSAVSALALRPMGIIISPGPSTPQNTGISMQVIAEASASLPILGVCLGHQAIATVFGGEVRRAGRVMHGKVSTITHDGRGVFTSLPPSFSVTRYHSLVVDALPDCLVASAWAEDDREIMGLRHAARPVEGVQFHPEAILTEQGRPLLANFVKRVRGGALAAK